MASTDEVLKLVAQMERARQTGTTSEEERKDEISREITRRVRETFNELGSNAGFTNDDIIKLFALPLLGAIFDIEKSNAIRLDIVYSVCGFLIAMTAEEISGK